VLPRGLTLRSAGCATGGPDAVAEFATVYRAIERHLAWAEDLASVREYAEASEALLDAGALAAEIYDGNEPSPGSELPR